MMTDGAQLYIRYFHARFLLHGVFASDGGSSTLKEVPFRSGCSTRWKLIGSIDRLFCLLLSVTVPCHTPHSNMHELRGHTTVSYTSIMTCTQNKILFRTDVLFTSEVTYIRLQYNQEIYRFVASY